MLTPQDYQDTINLIGRANISGAEAKAVALLLQKYQQLLKEVSLNKPTMNEDHKDVSHETPADPKEGEVHTEPAHPVNEPVNDTEAGR